MKLAVVLRHDCWLLHLLGHPISLQRSFHVPSCVRRSHCVLLQTCDPDMCSQLAVAERHCFPYGCFITFTFVCLFMLLYHGFVVPVAFITFFFFHILCFVCTPPLFIVSCILFFFLLLPLSYYLCLFLVMWTVVKGWWKQRVHVPTSCFVALWKYLCLYVFLWSLLFKCPESIFSLSHPLPLLSPHLCVRWCQRWWRENSAHWEENSVSIFGSLVVPS